jgi:hypothetical protein
LYSLSLDLADRTLMSDNGLILLGMGKTSFLGACNYLWGLYYCKSAPKLAGFYKIL